MTEDPTLLKQIPAHGLVASNAIAQNQLQEATGHNHSKYSTLIYLKYFEIMRHFLRWRVNQGGSDWDTLHIFAWFACYGLCCAVIGIARLQQSVKQPGNHNMLCSLGGSLDITCAHLRRVWIVSVVLWQLLHVWPFCCLGPVETSGWAVFWVSCILAANKEMLTPVLTFCLRAHRYCLRLLTQVFCLTLSLRWLALAGASPYMGPKHECKGIERGSLRETASLSMWLRPPSGKGCTWSFELSRHCRVRSGIVQYGLVLFAFPDSI